MQTITLNVEDEAVDKVLAMLADLSDVVIANHSDSDNASLSTEDLVDTFYPSTQGRTLTDDDIKEAVAQGALQSGMAGKTKSKRQAGLLKDCVAPPELYEPLSEDELEAQAKLTMEELGGCLSGYVTHRISDQEIEEAIFQGAYESGMAGKGSGYE